MSTTPQPKPQPKPTICLDFDGVLHVYTSPWTRADEISDGPTPGAIAFLEHLHLSGWNIAIFSSRSHQPGGMRAMQLWLRNHMFRHATATGKDMKDLQKVFDAIDWATVKPSATITLDDRALTFQGFWPTNEQLRLFKPWNKGGGGAMAYPNYRDAIARLLKSQFPGFPDQHYRTSADAVMAEGGL